MTNPRVLVTGAAGFIGAHLCRRAVAEGAEVVGLDDLSDGSLENLRDVPEVRFVEADLRDADAVRSAARGCDVIYHQGAKRSVLRSMIDPVLAADVNVGGTLNVLLAAREVGAAVVSASSSSVYGDQDTFPLQESFEPKPRSPYAVSKLAAEVWCAGMSRSFGVPAISLRYFNVYGPGMNPNSEYALVVPLFVAACLGGSSPLIEGDGEQARDFTYIDDVVEGNLLAARAARDAAGMVFNVGGGRPPTSVNRLLDLIAAATGVAPEPVYGPPRPGDVRRTHADISLARAVLGYEPSVPIEEGIRRTVDAARGVRV
jgi:nucleoside-diphosphate-sugar epimerase